MGHSKAHIITAKNNKVVDGDIRALCGREYLVITTVALVEGVRHAGGSPSPELVLASSFARHVETWNGRPIVVNHPVNAKGQAVLASDPDILEDSYLGKILNARLEVDRLIVEAWIDLASVASSSSKSVQAMWGRLEAEETVEVSVGAIVYTLAQTGKYQGKEYDGVWDIVIPDHLAFLDGGQIGACSVEDGCGTFRPLACGSVQLSKGVIMAAKSAMRTIRAAEGDVAPNTGACGCGGGKPEECTCSEGTRSAQDDADWLRSARAVSRALWASETFDMDRRSLLQKAIGGRYGSNCYVIAYNDEAVVFDRYVDGKGYLLYQLGYTSSADNTVTLADGTPKEVVFQMKTVEVPADKGKDKTMAKDSKGKAKAKDCKDDEEPDPNDPGESSEGEDEMPAGKSKGKGKGMAAANGLDGIETMEGLEKALAGTPLGKELSQSLKVASAVREKAITAILSSPGGKSFTKEMLSSVEFSVLDKMASAFKVNAAAAEEPEPEPQEETAVEDFDMGFLAYGEGGASDTVAEKDASGNVVEKQLTGTQGQRTASIGKAQNYAGRPGAPQRAASGRKGIPPPPDVFNFDDAGRLKA